MNAELLEPKEQLKLLCLKHNYLAEKVILGLSYEIWKDEQMRWLWLWVLPEHWKERLFQRQYRKRDER